MMNGTSKTVVLGVLLGSCLLTQTLQATTTTAPPACASAAHRQFDFWLGDWQVFKPDGTLAGDSRIRRTLGGCVLHEHYRTASGYEGESFNIFDSRSQRWHQSWVDNSGLLLQLDGALQSGSMVLEGDGSDSAGKPARQRISWTAQADGSLRQHWQSQRADGSWSTVFDGIYRRRSEPTNENPQR